MYAKERDRVGHQQQNQPTQLQPKQQRRQGYKGGSGSSDEDDDDDDEEEEEGGREPDSDDESDDGRRPGASASSSGAAPSASVGVVRSAAAAKAQADPDADADADDAASDLSLEPYDDGAGGDDPEAEDWQAGDGKVASLPQLTAALRKGDDVNGTLDALARVRERERDRERSREREGRGAKQGRVEQERQAENSIGAPATPFFFQTRHTHNTQTHA